MRKNLQKGETYSASTLASEFSNVDFSTVPQNTVFNRKYGMISGAELASGMELIVTEVNGKALQAMPPQSGLGSWIAVNTNMGTVSTSSFCTNLRMRKDHTTGLFRFNKDCGEVYLKKIEAYLSATTEQQKAAREALTAECFSELTEQDLLNLKGDSIVPFPNDYSVITGIKVGDHYRISVVDRDLFVSNREKTEFYPTKYIGFEKI